MSSDNYNLLINKLDEFIRKYYKNQLVRGGIYGGTVFLLFYLVVAVLEYYAHFDTVARTVLFYGFIVINGYIITRLIVIPLLKLNKLGSVISYEQASEIIGKHFSQVQDKLINVLQLQSSDFRLPTSDSGLIEASIDQKIKELKPIPFVAAIDISQNRKYLKYAMVPLLLMLFILFSAPSILTDSTRRIIKHDTYFEKEAPFQFAILNNNLKAIQHEDFKLDVKLTGDEIPENVYVLVDNNEFKLEREGTVDFNYLFKNVQNSISFQLSADGFTSKLYELTALPNPVLLNFEIALDYPNYTGKKDELIENSGDLIVPAGTKAIWKFHTQNTEWLQMSFNDTSFTIRPVAENNYSYSARLLKNKKYSVSTANSFLKNKDSVAYAINVVPDVFPAITVEERKDSLSNKRLYFLGNIKDDYGFTKLSFNYKYLKSADTAIKVKSIETPVLFNKSANQNQFYHFWDLSQIALTAGDEVEYYFEVFDNDGVNGAKSSRTQSLIYKAPTIDEIAKNAEEKNKKIKSDIQQSIMQAKAMQRELDELNKKVLEKKTLSWEEKKRLKELVEKQNELQKNIESIKNENEKNNFEQSEFKEQNESIAEKQRQLEELFKNVLTDEMKEKFKELELLMEQMDKNKMQEAIEKMKLTNKDIEKELDRNLEIFKQLEVEQKMQQTIDKLDDLAKRQEKESENSLDKNADSKQLKENQEQLNKEFEQAQKDMEDLKKKNEELEHPNDLGNSEEQQKEISQEMQNSKEQLGDDKKKKASESQKKASEGMKDLAQQMSGMMQKMEEESNSEDIQALRDILENLIHLSFEQESLMSELSKMKADNPNYPRLAQKQKKLQDDAQMIEDSLFALSKRNPQIESIVNREISAINMNMEKAIESLAERQSYEASSRQQFSMTSINNLALLLNESLSAMQEAQRKQGNQPGSGSCNKPGGTGKKPGKSNMSQMQEQINRQIQQMKEAMEKGGDKKGKQGQGGAGGTQGMSEQLAKLAAQQEALRRELQKSAEKYKDGKNGAGFNKMLEQMEQNESDLVNKMITQETIRRQQEILTRLLESEKADREREMDEQRQSNEAKTENYRNLSQFMEYNRLKQKETELLKTIPPSLNPFYKNKVNEYFNNFGK